MLETYIHTQIMHVQVDIVDEDGTWMFQVGAFLCHHSRFYVGLLTRWDFKTSNAYHHRRFGELSEIRSVMEYEARVIVVAINKLWVIPVNLCVIARRKIACNEVTK